MAVLPPYKVHSWAMAAALLTSQLPLCRLGARAKEQGSRFYEASVRTAASTAEGLRRMAAGDPVQVCGGRGLGGMVRGGSAQALRTGGHATPAQAINVIECPPLPARPPC